MNDQSAATTRQGLLRFMLYTDVNRRRAAQVGTDIWVDGEVLLGTKYGYGTEHELTFEELDNQPARYVVAMIPSLQQVTHPIKASHQTLLRTVYLTTTTLWPYFTPVLAEDLHLVMMPR